MCCSRFLLCTVQPMMVLVFEVIRSYSLDIYVYIGRRIKYAYISICIRHPNYISFSHFGYHWLSSFLSAGRLLDCYSNQTFSSTFDSYVWGRRTRQTKIRWKNGWMKKNNSKVKPKFSVDKCNGFRSIWIQIETRKRFGELLGK